jgi:hypothetical protein
MDEKLAEAEVGVVAKIKRRNAAKTAKGGAK